MIGQAGERVCGRLIPQLVLDCSLLRGVYGDNFPASQVPAVVIDVATTQSGSQNRPVFSLPLCFDRRDLLGYRVRIAVNEEDTEGAASVGRRAFRLVRPFYPTAVRSEPDLT